MGEAWAKPKACVEPWGSDSFAVLVEGRVVLRVRYPERKEARKERAEEIARRLNWIFGYSFKKPPLFRVSKKKDRVEAYGGEKLLFTVFFKEAEIHHSDPLDLALLWLNRVQMEFYGIGEGNFASSSRTEGIASWCHVRFHGKPTATGATYDSYGLTTAHRELPFHSVVLVTSLETGKRVIVQINDRGPWKKNRLIDLSLAAAKVLGMQKDGIERVCLEVIPWKK
ncbi:MAG: septal ring lytic transglycosylase RlpA family protein [Candidatus Caldatribacteriaceae bacterium]